MNAMFASYTPIYRNEVKKYSPRFYGEVIRQPVSLSLPYFLAKCGILAFLSAVHDLMSARASICWFCDFLQTAAPLLNLASLLKWSLSTMLNLRCASVNGQWNSALCVSWYSAPMEENADD